MSKYLLGRVVLAVTLVATAVTVGSDYHTEGVAPSTPQTHVARKRYAPARDTVMSLAREMDGWGTATRPAYPVAAAVVRHSSTVGIDPQLVVRVIRVENPWLVADTVSYAGAVGIMQVIPRFWSGVFPECGDDLLSVQDNVCVGVRVLAHYIDREGPGGLREALLAYNGCSRVECSHYSELVLLGPPGTRESKGDE